MKKFIYGCMGSVLLLGMAACHSAGGNTDIKATDSTYVMTGSIAGLDSGWIYLLHRQPDPQVLDSARIKEGKFVLTGKSTIPEFCLIGIGREGNKEFRQGFFVQSGVLALTGHKDSMETARITGVPVQDEYLQFTVLEKPIDSAAAILNSAYSLAESSNNKAAEDSIVNNYKELDKSHRKLIRDYVSAHPASYVGTYKLYADYNNNPDPLVLDSIYTRLDTAQQHSFFGRKMKEALESARKTAIGVSAPEFSLPDGDGKSVALSSFKGKYTLVDFWASWCGPCRKENPNVVAAYKKYHPRGFNILGVSLDNDKAKWQEAIKHDNLSWTQVSDLKGWQNSVAKSYGVTGIPTNLLLDKNGTIIAKDLRGDELEKKLAEILK